MTALIDTCIILDALEGRGEFSAPAKKIMEMSALKIFDGFLTASSVLNIFYLIRKHLHDVDEAKKAVDTLCKLFDVLDVEGDACVNALYSGLSDYEDAVTEETAMRNDMNYIVTRNMKDYANSRVKVINPDDFISIVRNEQS